jgi:hypothetical protein
LRTAKKWIEVRGIGWTKWVWRAALRHRSFGKASVRVVSVHLVRQAGVMYSAVGTQERHCSIEVLVAIQAGDGFGAKP